MVACTKKPRVPEHTRTSLRRGEEIDGQTPSEPNRGLDPECVVVELHFEFVQCLNRPNTWRAHGDHQKNCWVEC